MAKLKLKIPRGISKRIKVSPTGKLLRRRANSTHFNEKKSSARKRVIATSSSIKGAIAHKMKRSLGV
jgi:large subunit ribosomal protein L35